MFNYNQIGINKEIFLGLSKGREGVRCVSITDIFMSRSCVISAAANDLGCHFPSDQSSTYVTDQFAIPPASIII